MLTILAFLAGSLILDALAKPLPLAGACRRSFAGTILLWLLAGLPLGLFLAVGGNLEVSALLALALVGLFTMVSNAKHAMLGEALVFSDLALLSAVFRHPQFYFSALTSGQKALLAAAAPVMPLLLWWTGNSAPEQHLAGVLTFVVCFATIDVLKRLAPWSQLAKTPQSELHVCRHGLMPTIYLHWQRWRATVDPDVPVALPVKRTDDELVVMIQCESFADPVDLFGDPELALPALSAARAQAWLAGHLEVHGFGAYTMRTEYGVLFGRSEELLGFRRFDPYLTATGEGAYAMSARLAASGWRSVFVHPHDMRFYNRAGILDAAGFAELCGEESFARPTPEEGRYVTDAAMAEKILHLARQAGGPTFIYAVTIENHGPWSAAHGSDLRDGYLKLVRRSDRMLDDLMAGLMQAGRPSTLVFFGDHRPSIPGVSVPGGARHTPYVVVRYDKQGNVRQGSGKPNLAPADLHHAILNLLAGKD